MKIATWNVNSILARLPVALAVLKEIDADVWCLQEIKCEDHTSRAWKLRTRAATSRHSDRRATTASPSSRSTASRKPCAGCRGLSTNIRAIIEAVIAAPKGSVRVASIYAPNGNPIGTEKFEFKLKWMEALRDSCAGAVEA